MYLPNELLLEIASYLPIIYIMDLYLLNKEIIGILDNEHFWNFLLNRDFVDCCKQITYKQTYIKTYDMRMSFFFHEFQKIYITSDDIYYKLRDKLWDLFPTFNIKQMLQQIKYLLEATNYETEYLHDKLRLRKNVIPLMNLWNNGYLEIKL